MDLKIQNLVITCNLNCELDMEYLKTTLDNYNYNKYRFNGGILKLNDPKCTFLLFRTGKIVCLACKNMQDVQISLDKLKQLLIGYKIEITHLKVVNVVGSFNFGRRINIPNFCKMTKNATYEPEIYPAAIYESQIGKSLIFHTGKIIITGCKSVNMCQHLYNDIKNKLLSL